MKPRKKASLRKSISNKLRFEVFKRDSFTCQYCGQKPPSVVLNCDHIKPVSGGGKNDILNLITSCFDCNSGKSDRVLSDATVVEKQRAQLELLQQRREQIEQMFEWKKGLLDIDSDTEKRLAEYWMNLTPCFSLNELGRRGIRKLMKQFNASQILSAMRVAADTYFQWDDGKLIAASVEMAWNKIGGICNIESQREANPAVGRIYYVRGILRNRFSSYVANRLIDDLKQWVHEGVDVEDIVSAAKEARNIDEFIELCEGSRPIVL